MELQKTLWLKLFCCLAFTSLSLWSSPAYSADRFARCHQYDADIEKAVSRWWGVYDYPLAWKAQLYQESLCNPSAISPVGAAGLAQFMPATWRDMEIRFGVRMSPHSDIAINYGAYYMARQMRVWKNKRPQYERWRLGLAGYNAGTGNILKAQRKCDNSPMWSQIRLCLHLITGRHADETKTYVTRIERWWTELARPKPWTMPPELRTASDRTVIAKLQTRFNVRRYFNGTAWCTYWQPWPDEVPSGWISADHCHRQMLGETPPYILPRVVVRRAGEIDAVLYSPGVSQIRPRDMIEGEAVYILGYPGGSTSPSLRRGRVYIKRTQSASEYYTHPDTIILIETLEHPVGEATYEPVIGGMSGGLVASHKLEPLGVLVSQNGQTDLSGDGVPDSSADVVPLHDIWAMEIAEILE